MINIKDVQKFIKFARGTGKTFTVIEQAIKEYKNGKRCAIITNYPDVYIAHNKQFRKIINLKDIKSDSETIDILGLSTVLELIKNNNSVDRFKELPEFSKYDFVYVDADCYEQIIWQLLDNFEGMEEYIKDIQHLLIHVNNQIENIRGIRE